MLLCLMAVITPLSKTLLYMCVCVYLCVGERIVYSSVGHNSRSKHIHTHTHTLMHQSVQSSLQPRQNHSLRTIIFYDIVSCDETHKARQIKCVCVCECVCAHARARLCARLPLSASQPRPSITFSLSLCIGEWHVEGVLKTKAVFKKAGWPSGCFDSHSRCINTPLTSCRALNVGESHRLAEQWYNM